MSIVPYGETCAAFCFLEFYLMLSSVFRLLRLYRHLIIALHGHQFMQPLAGIWQIRRQPGIRSHVLGDGMSPPSCEMGYNEP